MQTLIIGGLISPQPLSSLT